MNTKNLKAYAPKARAQFIEAIAKRAAKFGIYEDKIAYIQFEGSAAIIEGRAFTKKQGEQRKQLERKINARSEATHIERYNLFIREMAYTWFNRLAAIRYMELHDYLEHGFRVLSPAPHMTADVQEGTNVAVDRMSGATPEILDNASDVAELLVLDKAYIIELQLAGDKEEELYRELLLGQCHYLAKIMPFVFKGITNEAIDDATELLLPDNLTKTDSILKGLVNEIPEEDWQEIEVIGWLYQFYISEHKDAVIGKVVKSEDIPAATQLFTPNWIVKYLVQNSLGRQWLATYPESKLVESLKEVDRKKKVRALELKGETNTGDIEGDVYYIEPAEQTDDVIEQLKAITPTSIDPEKIKVLDPAAGSGHILVEVYEVLREIYLERGYRLREIPELILTKNIYGLDIDDRAAQLAGFALMMKAREDDRRIFQRVQDGVVSLNIYSMQSTENLDIEKLWQALNLEGNQQQGTSGDLFSDELNDQNVGRDLSRQNDTDCKNDGLKPNLQNTLPITSVIPAKAGIHQENSNPENDSRLPELVSGSIYKEYFELLQTLKSAFLQAKTFGSLIQVDNQYLQNLIALKALLEAKEKGSDPSSKKAAFELLPIVNQAISLAQRYDVVVANPPYMGGKGMNVELKDFAKKNFPNSKADLFAVFIERGFGWLKEAGFNSMVTMQSWMFLSSYEKMRGSILSNYTIENMLHMGSGVMKIAFGTNATICRKHFLSRYQGSYSYCENEDINSEGVPNVFPVKNERLSTASSESFVNIPGSPIAYWGDFSKYFEENSLGHLVESGGRCKTHGDEKYVRYHWEISKANLNQKWVFFEKGGEYRRWFGNRYYVVNWSNSAKDFYRSHGGLTNEKYWDKKGVTWQTVTSSKNSFRIKLEDAQYSSVAPCLFLKNENSDEEFLFKILGSANSLVSDKIMDVLNPTMQMNPGDVTRIPLFNSVDPTVIEQLIELSKQEWNSHEVSSEFYFPYTINSNTTKSDFEENFLQLKSRWNSIIGLEIQNERNVDSNFETADVYEYLKLAGYEGLLTLETIYDSRTIVTSYLTQVISASIGMMMGRMSLDRKGLVYAHSGNEGFKKLVAEGVFETFPVDDDGIVPLASEDWLFEDDATARFREFVKTVWSAEYLQENLEFVAETLCLHVLKPVKGENPNDTIRRYFSTKFFKDHCQTYKKRPIYWLFSSGKEKAFECLVYLHRYNEGTLARMRTEYVTPLMGKYEQQQSLLTEQIVEASTTEKRRIEKELKSLEKKQAELRTFDEQLKHYAEKRITLDLYDGVKANYGKFGNLLADVKTIHGKAVK